MQNLFQRKLIPEILRLIFFLNLCSCVSLLSHETPELIRKASDKYETEKQSLISYKVNQIVNLEIEEDGIKSLEKRKQIGYFISPDKFIFILKSKELNGKKVKLSGEQVEKSKKKELEWISKQEINDNIFDFYENDGKIVKYKVTSLKISKDSKKGEIWIHKESYKIVRIIKEPSILPTGYEKYRTEIFFDKDLAFQEPSYTKLNTVFSQDGKKITANVEAIFENYTFNNSPYAK